MTKYQNILNAFYSTPLALLPEKAEQIRRFLLAKAAGGDVPPDEIRAVIRGRKLPVMSIGYTDVNGDPQEIVAARHKSGAQMAGRVAIVEVFGVLSQRVGMLEEASGGIGCEAIGAQLDSLVADKTVKCILMAFDSPGGSVLGVDELASKIRNYRDEKKIVGLADSVAASAAYYLFSQCSECNVTPGGMVGSIGVFAAHEDVSKMYDEEGVKVTLVSAGEYKTEGNPYAPLTDEAKAELQRQVDAYYGMFISAVAKGRGVSEARVKSDFGKGRMVMAADAAGRGMADKVATLDTVLRRLGAESPAAASTLGTAKARARLAEIDG